MGLFHDYLVLRNFDYYVNYSMVTGAVNIDLWGLAAHGSLYATSPDLNHHVNDYDKLLTVADDSGYIIGTELLIDGGVKLL